MTSWHFRSRDDMDQPVDASCIQRVGLSRTQPEVIAKQLIRMSGRAVPIGELFHVDVQPSEHDRIVFEGDLSTVDAIGFAHDHGELHVEGNVGSHFGSGATGGRLVVAGDAGHFVGGPLAGQRLGLSGATLKVNGNVGDYDGTFTQ